jgi:succinoglycan biosynthesis transport protein ExoP
VTSAVAGEGKTSLVCNLAAAFGLEGDRVLLIDADLRRPSVGNYLGINRTFGLSTVLLGECQPDDAVESWRGGLFDVLTSGPIPENPSELLGSKRTSVMLTEFESLYDVVLIDSPALLPVADGSVLARACDAVLLVVRHSHTPASEVTDALAALRAVSAHVLGCAFSMEPQPSRTFRRSQPSPVPRTDVTPSRMSSHKNAKPSPGAEMTMANQVPVDRARPDGPDQ